MCVMSMVVDYYKPQFDRYVYSGQNQIVIYPDAQPDWGKLVREFREAIQAAKRVDDLTGQPDCVDPEKAKLTERVAELERKIAEMGR